MPVPSNLSTPRRITPADEAALRRYRAEMKFAYTGPFSAVLGPIRPAKPARSKSGLVLERQPRYTPDSPESYAIWTRLEGTVRDVLLPFMAAAGVEPKRRRKVSS